MTALRDLPRPVIHVDGALAVLDCSRRCLALFGVGDEDGSSARLAQVLAATDVLGDELALATASLTQPGDEKRFEWRRDERVFDVSVSADGSAANFLVWFEDVTDSRRLGEIQLEARHYLEQILADVPLGVAVLDARLRVTFANAAALALLGRICGPRELVDVIGAGLDDLVTGDVGGRWRVLCAQARDEVRRIDGARETFDRAEGQLVLSVAAHPLHDRRGERAGAIFVLDDVTERAHLERELIRMEKLATVGQMVVTVNHEINNPLAIISTNAQSARLLNKELDERTVTKLQTIEEQVKRISAVTERLRTMDEVESNDYIADGPKMIDLGPVSGAKQDET